MAPGTAVVEPSLDAALPALAARHRLVVTVEDGGRVGGVGAAVAMTLRDAGVPTPVKVFGLPQQFLAHASRAEVLSEVGLVPQELARQIVEAVAKLDQALEPAD